jgi:PIN domain nuclease of toxin-antitoxin system
VRVLLDTQVVYLAASGNDSLFSPKAKELMLNPDNERLLSTTSLLEIAIKSAKGAIGITKQQTDQLILDLRLTVLPFTANHASWFFDLPLHHKDPFDRMLIATALAEGVPIISGDRQLSRYKGLNVIQ